MQTKLIKKIIELCLPTTHQARIIKAPVWKVKGISQGRKCSPLTDKQVSKRMPEWQGLW